MRWREASLSIVTEITEFVQNVFCVGVKQSVCERSNSICIHFWHEALLVYRVKIRNC